MLTSDELRAFYDRDQRMDFREPGFHRLATPFTVRQINDRVPESFILHTSLATDHVDQVIAAEIAYFEGIGHSFEWKVFSHDAPPDLVQRLVANGFTAGAVETILVLDMQALTGVLTQPVTHDIRRVTDAAALRTFYQVASQVFERDLSAQVDDLVWQLAEHPDYMSFYGAYVDHLPVASARVNFSPNSLFASLWGGGTLDAYRGRGIYTALVAARVQEALARGRRFLTIDASPMSRPIVHKLGFVPICTSVPCYWNTRR